MNVLVYGFYGKGNIGDELFRCAFIRLFPWISFRFVDEISESNIEGIDAVFFGGGSFMYAPPKVTPQAMRVLCKKPIFYVGVGVEHIIDPVHQALLTQAKCVFVRTSCSLDFVKKINPETYVCADIVFALNDNKLSEVTKNTVLVIPNVETVPKHTSAHWMHVSWEHFKNEFAQVLDELVEKGRTVRFLPFCKNAKMDDTWAASEIVSRMTHRSTSMILPVANENDVIETISSYETVITQRFHGIVLSQIAQRPCLVIHHHDKLKFAPAVSSVSFYEASKCTFLSELARIQGSFVSPVNSFLFDELVSKITNELLTNRLI